MENRVLKELSAGRVSHDSLKKAMSYMETNFSSSICIKDVARECGLSSSHLARLFRQQLGSTFTAYLSALRVERAAKLVLNGKGNLLDISRTVGFGSEQYFYRQFKKKTGQTPREFEKSQRSC